MLPLGGQRRGEKERQGLRATGDEDLASFAGGMELVHFGGGVISTGLESEEGFRGGVPA